ncbi:hypothetical protein GCM10027047_32530 [Rhodococcus aerolatus]
MLRSADVGTTPVPLRAHGADWVAVRLAPGAPVSVLAARCPHRLVPLAGAAVVDGRVQCPYHGWQFDGSGACVTVPSHPGSTPPPRASLATPPAVRETDGTVWVAAPEPVPGAPTRAEHSGGRDVLGNDHPALAHAWHPVGLLDDLPTDGSARPLRLLGRTWTLRRAGDGRPEVDEPAHGVEVRHGMVWLAPAEPRDVPLVVPEADDPRFVAAWLPPSTTSAPAGLLADNFLDAAHFPFVHAATIGAEAPEEVEPVDHVVEPGGFTSVAEQLFANPEDPGVLAGVRPLQQRRRATYVYRAPFQLLLRLEELDAGAVKTILFVLTPADADRTVVHTCMLLHGIGGRERPDAATVAAEVAFEERVLAEDLALQDRMDSPGLPLVLRDEVHVRADRLGVALRRALRAFTERAATP